MSKSKFAKLLLGEVPIGKEKEYYYYSLLPSLEDYNRADTVNMSPQEMNTFRHLAGSKQALGDLGFPRGFGALLYKEIQDLKNNAGLEDTLYDLKNDIKAVNLHIKKPDLESEALRDYVFKTYIKPKRK